MAHAYVKSFEDVRYDEYEVVLSDTTKMPPSIYKTPTLPE